MLDAADGGLLNSMRRLLSDIFIPTLRARGQAWGELEGLQEAPAIRQEFLSSLEGFVSVLSGAQESLKEKVSTKKLLLQKWSMVNKSTKKYVILPLSSLNPTILQILKKFHGHFLFC